MTLVKEATALYKYEKLRIGLEEMIYAFDSSTIELCLKLCPWAEFHHGKGAFKMHTLMDLRGSIPTFVLLTPGKVNDAKVMDKIPVERGSFYLMDKGYVAFEKLHKYFHQKGAFFVTRAKDNMVYDVIESMPVDKNSGVLSDESIRLIGYYSIKKYPDTLRLVVYEDFEAGKVYHFLTNNFSIEDPLTIAELYRERWQIELFFKWIKQHLQVKRFWGESENAVRIQIHIAIITYCLIAIIEHDLKIGRPVVEVMRILGKSALTTDSIRDLLQPLKLETENPDYGQLSFDFKFD